MKSIILAAGRGTRLYPHTKNLPKHLLKVGDKTILEQVLDRVVYSGVDQIVIVVGFKGQLIMEKIGESYNGASVRYINNPKFDQTNNIYSLWLAVEETNDDFVLINGDTIFSSTIIKNLINSKHKNAAAVDESKTDLPDEAMKVTLNNKMIIDVSKKIPKERTHGDAIGLYKFSPEGASYLFNEIKNHLDEGKSNVFYLSALSKSIGNFDLYSVDISNHPWIEIDDENDLREAQNVIKKIEKEEKLI